MEEEEQEVKNKNGRLSASTSASNGESISNDSWKNYIHGKKWS